ncbi:MAG TPA: DMT family transporter [Bradyrhizobium sp.]
MLPRNDATLPGLILALVFCVEFAMIYADLGLTTASRAVLLLYTAPFFTAIGAHLILPAKRLRPVQVIGLTLAFSGVAAAFAEGLLHGRGNLLGDALSLGAGALWGGTNVLIKGNGALRRTDADGFWSCSSVARFRS